MKKLIPLLLSLVILFSACSSGTVEQSVSSGQTSSQQTATVSSENSTTATGESQVASGSPANKSQPSQDKAENISIKDLPVFSGSPYIKINNNEPAFPEADFTTKSFESYSNLDGLGRCGVAYANVGKDIMPTGERGSIGQVKPSGWHTVKYDVVDGKYLYNRCHLIGYQLSAENANTKNLITGTRYLNVDGMLPFENMVADYIKETGNHVLYRVTPIFDGNNLLASGVQMEAMSVEDKGDGISFNVFCYNVQPGVTIDYATGDSQLASGAVSETQAPVVTPKPEQTPSDQPSGQTYILNTNTHKFHYPSCSSVKQMNEANKKEYTGSRDNLIAQGYDPCGICNP